MRKTQVSGWISDASTAETAKLRSKQPVELLLQQHGHQWQCSGKDVGQTGRRRVAPICLSPALLLPAVSPITSQWESLKRTIEAGVRRSLLNHPCTSLATTSGTLPALSHWLLIKETTGRSSTRDRWISTENPPCSPHSSGVASSYSLSFLLPTLLLGSLPPPPGCCPTSSLQVPTCSVYFPCVLSYLPSMQTD